MTVRYSTGARNALNDSGLAAFDGGTARINVYDGTLPATGDTAAAGTLLATLTPASDVWAASSGGVAAAGSITQDSAADAAGHPGYCVLYRTGDTAPGSTAVTADRRILLTAGVNSTLNGAINNSVTTITLASTLGFPTSGTVLIESELITYSGISSNDLTGCTRGTGGTSAASHSSAVAVYESGPEVTFNNANFSGSGATAGFVLNAQVTMSALSFTWPANV